MTSIPKLRHLEAAHAQIAPSVHRTPVVSSSALSERIGHPMLLKCENLQKTGSFKVRGALNALLEMNTDERANGVVTVSAGNHAQAVAWAAAKIGMQSTVVMNAQASPTKARASESYGANVILHGTALEAFELSSVLAKEHNLTFIHPFDDPTIVAGHATVGIEILDEVPEASTVVVPIGGGGLISGVSLAASLVRPGTTKVFGVEPEGACAMRKSLDEGTAVHLESVDTIADGLAAPMAGELNFEIIQRFVEDIVVVSDSEIQEAMAFLLARTKLLVEPAGAASVAALLAGKIHCGDGPVVALLSGGNVDLERLAELLPRSDRQRS
ncbi:MAG: threonine/serine dehydratase [Gemmatimonadota bacterium]|nr:threonine/serine dehydratase [Gemmatimonadota bacterium]